MAGYELFDRFRPSTALRVVAARRSCSDLLLAKFLASKYDSAFEAVSSA